MKFAPRDNRSALSIGRLTLALTVAALVPILLYGSAPSWWSERGVLVENSTADDFAPVNQGQLKNLAQAAVAEMDAKLTGGAGPDLHNLINGWSSADGQTNDYAPVNLGQLKNVAKPFYDRLIAAGRVDHYPWLGSTNLPDDFSVANIGQAKNLFAFEIPTANILSDPLQDRLAASQRAGNLALEAEAVWFWGNRFVADSSFQSTYPRRLSALSGIMSVSAGDDHRVALTENGLVLAWGKNRDGQLGDGTNTDRETPLAVPNLANIISAKAGGAHTLALQQDGTVFAWGDNYSGQLGNGDNVASSSPVQVVALTNVVKIAAGPSRSVALKNDGTVWTWGYDHYAWETGQEISRNVPAQVADLTDVIDIAAGYEHVLAVKADGTIWGWGSNYANQLGNGNPSWMFQRNPSQIPNLANVAKVTSNFDHSLALLRDGTVWAWGANQFGQLGNGTTEARRAPAPITGLTNVIAIATSYSYSLAMKSDGTVWTWGLGSSGILPSVDLYVPQQVGLGLFDTNHNGIDDRWELNYLGNLDATAESDFDGDGISDLKEFLRGTDPRDYFNGTLPVIEIVSGNNQLGNPATLLPKPLKVRIKNASGQILVNAPVHFRISSGSALLTPAPGETLVANLIRRSDATGQASAYVMLPEAPGASARIAVSPASPGSSTAGSVTFRAASRFVLPATPTPAPNPNPSATPSPTPTATTTPPLPYRYAVIDLGKDVYPIRINNKGWILIEGPDADGNWGHYRWKGGVSERLANFDPYTDTRAIDMNDDGTVVGRAGDEDDYRRLWVDNRENEFQVALKWAANTNVPVKVSGPAKPHWSDSFPGTMRLAHFSAISNRDANTNEADIYGGLYTGGAYSWFQGFDIRYIINAQRWSGDSAPAPLSFSSSTRLWPNGFAFSVFDWQGPMDGVLRANSSRHYIGRRKTPASGQYYGGSDDGMVDGQSVAFDPVDINEAGLVVGSAGADMVVQSSPTSQVTISGASPLAINDHTRPAPLASPQVSPAPTPVPAPQILAWAGNALVVWERQEDGRTWHPFGLEEMVPNMDGWDALTPYDMNDTGAIIGSAWYTDPSNPLSQAEQHGFLLVPVELMVDGNRDGDMSFTDRTAHEADQTSEEKPYRFWVNDDDDGAAGDPGDHVPASVPDYADGVIRSVRDLEDFARLHVALRGLEDALESGSVKAAFEWAEASNNPRIKLYRAISAGTDYLTSESEAASASLSPFRDTLGEVAPGVPLFIPQSFWVNTPLISNVPKTVPFAWFLFEGSGEGKGQLVLSFWQNGRRLGKTSETWLDVKDVRKMYQRANATPDFLSEPYASRGSLLNEESIGYSPDVSPRFEPPFDEDEHCLIFVHGWKATEHDATSASQTMFKRLWWEGYRGRFAAFRWPTKTSAISYNTSEWLAWKYGKSLADYVTKYVRQEIPAYRISVAAHSMGNVVTGAALRRGITLDKHLLMEAAIPAGCYNDSVNNYARFLSAEADHQTPDTVSEMGYRLFLASTRANVGKFVSFFNIDDFALATGVTKVVGWPFETNWEKNQVDYKPDSVGSGQYVYLGSGVSHYLTVPDDFRKITDVHESMAFVARPRSRAAGAELHNATVFGSVLNLQTSCNFGADADDHSGQFTRPIQQLRPFYQRMASELKQ